MQDEDVIGWRGEETQSSDEDDWRRSLRYK